MSKIFVLFLVTVAAFAADDPWAKVRDLKGGVELRVFKKGSTQPILAKMDQLTDENLLVVVKSQQVAIARDQIDRIDYRPVKSRVTTETKTKTTEPDTTPAPPGYASRTPGTSSTSSVGITSRPDFEEIYRRPTPAPKK